MLLTVRYDAREVDRLMYGSLGFLFYESMQSQSIRSMKEASTGKEFTNTCPIRLDSVSAARFLCMKRAVWLHGDICEAPIAINCPF